MRSWFSSHINRHFLVCEMSVYSYLINVLSLWGVFLSLSLPHDKLTFRIVSVTPTVRFFLNDGIHTTCLKEMLVF